MKDNKKKQRNMFNFWKFIFTYRYAIMMMELACDQVFRIVVNVGWEQFT